MTSDQLYMKLVNGLIPSGLSPVLRTFYVDIYLIKTAN